jgi:cephalosporin hydroxylase
MTTTDPIAAFRAEVERNIDHLGDADAARATSARWLRQTHDLRYDYNFTWFGRPILQLPQDVMALQELVFRIQPDLVVETGIAHGGSLVFFASLLHLLGGNGLVLGIDRDIRAHNRAAIESHPMAGRIAMYEGSSVDPDTLAAVRRFAAGRQRVMVVLDSNHTEAHVLQELQLYGPLVTSGSYLVVCDTIVEDLGDDAFPDRPWGPGNSPKSAVAKFLQQTPDFEVDSRIEQKLLLTNSPGGYLRCRR